MQADGMLGIVLCAGLGTRLRPLTLALPKPAVPVGPVPAALRNIEQLLAAGISVVHCNTHYLAGDLEVELKEACKSRHIPSSAVKFWNEPDILETGGGIVRIAHECAAEAGIARDALVVSGDIVADIPLQKMLTVWRRRKGHQTSLMVSLPLDKPRKDITWVDEGKGTVHGFGADVENGEASKSGLAARVFSNHQIISSQILGRSKIEKRSSIDLFYRSAISRGEEILHVPFDPEGRWFDIGTPESYLACMDLLNQNDDSLAGHQSLGMINLCLPHQQVISAASGGANRTEPACAGSSASEYARSCMSMTTQSRSWTCLGRIHASPQYLTDGLTGMLTSLDRTLAGLTRHSPEPQLPLHLSPLSGDFLLGTRSLSSLDQRAGFIFAPLPSALAAHPLLQRPLLVPLDLVASFHSSASLPLSDNPSPFWLVFTRQLP
ncbi:MAG: hypothetical protein EBR09_01450 [Proteobacteria bacterium]|nr:hypothetical protein [Pseudomonadota bacterium]